MFKQLGDYSCWRNRSIVPSITYDAIFVLTIWYNDSLHAFLWIFFMH